MKKSNLFLITPLILTMSACERVPESWNWGAKPRPLTGIKNFPSTDTDYGKGFKSGCTVAFNAVTKGLTSDFSGHKLNPEMLTSSPDFASGWWDGFEQCTYITDWDVV